MADRHLSVVTTPDRDLIRALPRDTVATLTLTGTEIVWLHTHLGAEPYEGEDAVSDRVYAKARAELERLLNEGASDE